MKGAQIERLLQRRERAVNWGIRHWASASVGHLRETLAVPSLTKVPRIDAIGQPVGLWNAVRRVCPMG